MGWADAASMFNLMDCAKTIREQRQSAFEIRADVLGKITQPAGRRKTTLLMPFGWIG
jgi:hypothetical protein